MKKRAVAFGDIRQHPFDRDVGDRVRRRRGSRLHQEARRRVVRGDLAGHRAGHDQRRVNLAGGDDLIDFGLGLAEDADSVPRRFEGAFGRLLIGGRLFHLPFGNAVGSVKVPGARQFLAR